MKVTNWLIGTDQVYELGSSICHTAFSEKDYKKPIIEQSIIGTFALPAYDDAIMSEDKDSNQLTIVLKAFDEHNNLVSTMKFNDVEILGYNDYLDDEEGGFYNFAAKSCIPWRSYIQEEDHQGMIYNPYNDSWAWL